MIDWQEVHRLAAEIRAAWHDPAAVEDMFGAYPDGDLWQVALFQAREARLRRSVRAVVDAWEDGDDLRRAITALRADLDAW